MSSKSANLTTRYMGPTATWVLMWPVFSPTTPFNVVGNEYFILAVIVEPTRVSTDYAPVGTILYKKNRTLGRNQ